MDLHLTGKVAVITGGSAGIGAAIARGLAAEGAHVALVGRDTARLDEVATSISGVRVLTVPADLTEPDSADRVAAAVAAEFGGADILINNAGTGSEETILEAPDSRWQFYWELHVMAAVRLARTIAPQMKARGGGVILHNASICATQPLGYEPIYNTTKAALVMFSKCLANELIGDNIRVNAVKPGLVLTGDWIKTAKSLTADSDQTWEQYLQKIADDNAPIGRFATPEEVADFFVFLCSSRAAYSVGSTYYVDGGWLRTTT
ncbi:short-chain dehydrogenase [Paractinoplanes abujensis]|uniref:NAD(P)-dependent dehydrogenase (Short-subunit alcohol dehydrogenase family) n=1 Tax=Paractinoplanes abujensis TaxID=882441 RepID=A0A7W7CZR7_9ACTN|nr:SDR family oxidoreductase [Actinoplanes abujensis]MBB4697591.1 NAD(P)-dependent dehydrogenase (short-subunit alcohol dehydrogenase family) [Actinoplanes abujensis]GID19919.1 short-chain dehydrogenase [Actinoplanes abujensis]